jgi:hypothetical protein
VVTEVFKLLRAGPDGHHLALESDTGRPPPYSNAVAAFPAEILEDPNAWVALTPDKLGDGTNYEMHPVSSEVATNTFQPLRAGPDDHHLALESDTGRPPPNSNAVAAFPAEFVYQLWGVYQVADSPSDMVSGMVTTSAVTNYGLTGDSKRTHKWTA